MSNRKVDPHRDYFQIPVGLIPNARTTIAVQNGVERNLLFRTWGGLGDQACAEPTLRYALKSFKGCTISLASEQPEMFAHLTFDRVYDLRWQRPVYENFLCFETITPPDDSNLVWQFFSHMLVNCVDFPSLCALRCQLPVKDREVTLSGVPLPESVLDALAIEPNYVVVHAGRHWQSKTFPVEWWNRVLMTILAHGCRPVLIGADTDDNRGTVDVSTEGCVDLRNQLSVTQTITLLSKSRVLLTNDSSPLHLAAPGNAWIGYVATCKHPDMITHWRKGEWGWRMKNFGRGGIWNIIDNCPNKASEVTAERVPEIALLSWLPDPEEFAGWACDKAAL